MRSTYSIDKQQARKLRVALLHGLIDERVDPGATIRRLRRDLPWAAELSDAELERFSKEFAAEAFGATPKGTRTDLVPLVRRWRGLAKYASRTPAGV